jgi:SpoVK/Ycf46/Vps4 family AAA+-type ATPase
MLSIDHIVSTTELVGVEEEVRQLAEWLVRFEQRTIYKQSRKYSNECNNESLSCISGGIVTGLPGTGKTALVYHVASRSIYKLSMCSNNSYYLINNIRSIRCAI